MASAKNLCADPTPPDAPSEPAAKRVCRTPPAAAAPAASPESYPVHAFLPHPPPPPFLHIDCLPGIEENAQAVSLPSLRAPPPSLSLFAGSSAGRIDARRGKGGYLTASRDLMTRFRSAEAITDGAGDDSASRSNANDVMVDVSGVGRGGVNRRHDNRGGGAGGAPILDGASVHLSGGAGCGGSGGGMNGGNPTSLVHGAGIGCFDVGNGAVDRMIPGARFGGKGRTLNKVEFNYISVPLYRDSLRETQRTKFELALAKFAMSNEHADFQHSIKAEDGFTRVDILLDTAVCAYIHECYQQMPGEEGLAACEALELALTHRNRFLTGKLLMTTKCLASWRMSLMKDQGE
jgi:hypothetical protein